MTTQAPLHAVESTAFSPQVEWRLRMAAAQRGIWTGTELRRLLAERTGLDLSAASVSALFTKQPSQVKLSTLAALCAALDCTPGDLLPAVGEPAASPPPTPRITPPPPPLQQPAPPVRHGALNVSGAPFVSPSRQRR
ncbi:helix-turn-helix domain-containing protein [Embleya scabrispora]|uniref:helix-turn-helix domain-containing protein n=1 Tax=Embleya scabrispora TaxID=159449 RepID=UPI000381A31E|nr:helix-turn-helix transcriptional regulator [Embleya scabrispora]MYS80275.1 helix-turn-helix domain-containing protein [Streptomyces sp. SID5474]